MVSFLFLTYFLFLSFATGVFVVATALVAQSFVEWVVHKYILHGLGKKKHSFFYHHWQHHKFVRKHDNEDISYQELFQGKFDSLVLKEMFSIVLINLLISVPLIYFGNFILTAYGVVFLVTSWAYFFIHAYSHVNIEFGKKVLPWHYDHHFGKNQDLNWGVTTPIADWVLGTRKVYQHDDRLGRVEVGSLDEKKE